jgi:hypothetical protein
VAIILFQKYEQLLAAKITDLAAQSVILLPSENVAVRMLF